MLVTSSLLSPARSEDETLIHALRLETADWSFNDIRSAESSDEGLRGSIVGADPYMVSKPFAPQDAGKIKRIVVQMKTAAGKVGQIFWITQEQPTYSDKRHVDFPIQSDGQWHEYVIETGALTSWSGHLIGLRLDPVADSDAKPDQMRPFAVKAIGLHGEAASR